MQVILNLLELDRIEYKVKLRFTIEGQNITLRTKPNYNPAPIILQGGVPEMLSGLDVAHYLNPENLDFTGITKAEFVRGGTFPEGFYTFTVEVLDYVRNVPVSNMGMANAWIVLNDPPLINMPFKNEITLATDPQNIMFSWTPLHMASPNAAFSTEYEITLVEVYPEGRNPNDAILASTPYFQTTTYSTSLMYGLTEPLLTPGRKYAFRIRVYDLDGRDLFKNNGYSETSMFQFGEACLPPNAVTAQPLGDSRVKLEWEPQDIHTLFEIEYKKKGTENWYSETSYVNALVVPDLQKSTTYEYRVRGSCGSIIGSFTELASVTTEDISEDAFVCGASAETIEIDTSPFQGELQIGDVIKTADFEIKLQELEANGDGTYKGIGEAIMPWLNRATVRVKFDAIRVNEDYRVYEGLVSTIYNPDSKFILEVGGAESDDPVSEEVMPVETEEEIEIITSDNEGIIALDDNISEVSINENGDIVVTKEGGASEVFSKTLDPETGEVMATTITDGNGESWTVDEQGNVSGGTGTSVVNNNEEPVQENTIIEEGLSIGPLLVQLGDMPESPQTDSEGYCIYNEIDANFDLSFKGQYDISKQVRISGATISFKRHCESGEIKGATISWTSAVGIDIGEVQFIDASVHGVSLTVNQEGKLSGSINLKASLTENKTLKKAIVLNKGLEGDFTFNYQNTELFNGYFDFNGIAGIKIDVVKEQKVLASLKGATLDKDGKLEGTLTKGSGLLNYKSSGIDVALTKFNAGIVMSMEEGFSFTSGAAEFVLSDIKGIDGSLNVGVVINEDIVTSTVHANQLSGYGFTFSNVNISAAINTDFDVEGITGQFDVTHDELNTSIGINEFEVKDGVLHSFSGSGQIVYDDLDINITNIIYDAESEQLNIGANVEVETNGMRMAAEVYGFAINKQGDIAFGGYNAEMAGTLYFGPLAVALVGETKELEGGKWRSCEAEASFYLQVKNDKGVEKEVPITGAKMSFERHRDGTRYRNISISVEDAEIDFGELYFIEAKLKSLDISIDSEEEELTGNASDKDKSTISGASSITFDAGLTKDKSISQLITLKKGISGEFTFNLEAGKELKGDFDLGGIENINLAVVKNEKDIASLTNATINSEGLLEGTISALENATYNSGGFTVTLEEMALDVSLSLPEGIESLEVKSGHGKVKVSEIEGVEGDIGIDLAYDADNNFNAVLSNEQSELQIAGMIANDLMLEAEFSQMLELNNISGGLSLVHTDFDAVLSVSDLLIEQGELKTLSLNGKVAYKAFGFELEKSTYNNGDLLVTAKVEIESAGKLAVDRFNISNDGAISIGEIEGNLNKPMVAMEFNAAFEEDGFSGAFAGDVNIIALNGSIAFGTKEDYSYGYLSMGVESKAGAPLGSTGLKLTKVGGRLGYNYKLDYANGDFSGSPFRGNYLVGLTLGVSDVGEMFAAEGTTLVQFGKEEIELNLSGSISAPRESPIIKSDFDVNYKMPDNSLEGILETDIQIPAASGMVFSTTTPANISFAMANESWSVDGAVVGSIFSAVTFNGNSSLNNKESSVSGYLKGVASYSYSKSISYDWSFASVDASLELGFISNVDASVNETGFDGKINVDVTGSANLIAHVGIFGSTTLALALHCDGEISYANGQGKLEGNADVLFTAIGSEYSKSLSVNQNF